MKWLLFLALFAFFVVNTLIGAVEDNIFDVLHKKDLNNDTPQVKDPIFTTSCNTSKLDSCFNKLYQQVPGLGVLPRDAFQFSANLLQYFSKNGLYNGYLLWCRGFDGLVGCLGSMYSTCMSVPGLTHVGLKPMEATAYAVFFGIYQYNCGAGLNTFANQLACFTQASQLPSHQQCIANFKANISGNINEIQFCQTSQQLVTCDGKVYMQTCGKALGWGVCAGLNRGFQLAAPYCQKFACPAQYSVPEENETDIIA